MKKLVLMFAVVFGMSFFACGNKEAAAEATVEEAVVEEVVEEAPCCAGDSVCCDSLVEAVAEVVEAVAE